MQNTAPYLPSKFLLWVLRGPFFALTVTDFVKAKSKFPELGFALAEVGSVVNFISGLATTDVGGDEGFTSCNHVASVAFKEARLNGMDDILLVTAWHL